MAQKRVHEIAKERGLPSAEVLVRLRAAGMEVTAAQSVVDEAEALRVLGGNGASAPPARSRGADPGQPPARPAAPRPAQGDRPAAPGRGRRVFEPDGPPLQVTPRSQREDERPRPVMPPRPPMPRPGQGDAPEQDPGRPDRAAARGPRQGGPAARQSGPAGRSGSAQRSGSPAPARPSGAPPARPAPARQVGPRIVGTSPPQPAPQRPAQARPSAPPPQARPAAPPPAQARPPAPQPAPAAPPAPQPAPAAPQAPQPPQARAPQAPPPRPPEPQRRAAATALPNQQRPQTRLRRADEAPTTPRQRAPRTYDPAAPAPGTGPRIIAQPPPPEPAAPGAKPGEPGQRTRPQRDETQQTGAARPGRPGGVRDERGPGGGRRRVVIDSQASRRPAGPGGPVQMPQRKPRRGRRRRSMIEEQVSPLDAQASARTDVIRVNSGSTVKDVAEYIGVPVTDIIKRLMAMGEMATLTQTLSDDAITVLATDLGREVEVVHAADDVPDDLVFEDLDEDLVERPPVVTIMGHVDHGKTSLLDAIRETEVVKGEAGGITQHIGAYQVRHDGRTITFLDTPGHEAFTAMRARGASVTDIAVIVVAADDGARPQTDEAIDHARAADVPMVVAVNKIDKEGADPTRVRTELTQRGLQPAEWGGDTEFVDVSAKTRENLDALLETILVVAELEEIKANPAAEASGVVIESKLDPGRGPVVTVLIQRGTLKVGDALVAGSHWGRVRAMHDHTGERLTEAVPGQPVEVLGFDGVPDAGESVRVVENDRTARSLANERAVRLRNEAQARRAGRKTSFDELFKGIQAGHLKELNLVLKADVSGSLEAFEDEIARLPQDEVQVNVIHSGVGGISESDVMLAAASDAVILGFNVRPVGDARAVAEREGVEIRAYSVIYKALDDLRDAMSGMLEPEEVEETVGTVEVRAVFRASRIGTIAGCYVTDGKVTRGAKLRVVRNGTVIYDTTVESLKRFNDDAREVTSGYECGIVLARFQDVKEGDVFEVYETRQIERSLA